MDKALYMFLADVDNNDANSNNVIFTIKDKLFVPVVTLSAGDNQKLPKLLLF